MIDPKPSGAFLPVGIRIGLDAKERLKAHARGLSVTYDGGEKPPCPCVADGVMIATQASPGQGTLRLASERAPQGMMAAIVIRNRKTGEVGWNKLDPAGRFDAAMAAEHLFDSEPAP